MVVATLAVKYDSVKREIQCLNKIFWPIGWWSLVFGTIFFIDFFIKYHLLLAFVCDFAIIFGDLFNMASGEVTCLRLCVCVFAFF